MIIRIRFTSPHPKDFPSEVLYLIRDRHNICNSLHMPAQVSEQIKRDEGARIIFAQYVGNTWQKVKDEIARRTLIISAFY